MERFEDCNIHFSDTLPLLRKMKKDGDMDKMLKGVKLGMGSLHQHFLDTEIQGMGVIIDV